MSQLSIIVPCYNAQLYVKKCLDSLVNQSFGDFTVIIIDDGSTDNTKDVVDFYVKLDSVKFKYIYQENGGIASVRNLGLKHVTTKYFGFLDSDDYFEDTMIEKMINKIKSENSQLVVCNFTWIYDDISKNRVTTEGPYNLENDMMINLFATLWNKIYDTEFIKSLNIQFPDNYRYEDASFLYKITPHIKKISFINESLINYVQRDGSITHTHNSKVKDMIYVFDDILNYYKKNDLYELYKDELEFLFIKFFLGNSFLRTIKITDKKDRKITLQLSWDILNNNFKYWKKNKYIKGYSARNMYYKLISKSNYNLFATLFNIIIK